MHWSFITFCTFIGWLIGDGVGAAIGAFFAFVTSTS